MRQLDMTLISAKDLKDVNVQGKMDLYAVATLSCDPHNGKSTPIDRGCGKNANWNCPIQFNIPEGVDGDNLGVDILIRCQMRPADRVVGEVHILVKELESGGERKFVSYQVRTSSGRAQGVLDLSYKFATLGNMRPAVTPPPVKYPPTLQAPPYGPTYPAYAGPPPGVFWNRPQAPYSGDSGRIPGCCRPPQAAESPGCDTKVQQQPSSMSKFGSIVGTVALVIASVIGGAIASSVARNAAGDYSSDDE